MFELEKRIMISPGAALSGTKGFKSLANVYGLLVANKQISAELLETLYSNNTFLVPVNETIQLKSPGQIFRAKIDPSMVSKIQNLCINICTELHPFDTSYQAGVARVKGSMKHIVDTLNNANSQLKSLTVRYTSCYPAEVEEIRREADALIDHPGARNIQVMRACDGRLDELDLTDTRLFFLHGANIADAIECLTIPVQHFDVYGDMSGRDINRLYIKFGIDKPQKPDNARLDRWGQKMNVETVAFREMGRANPGTAAWGDMIGETERRPCASAKAERVRHEILIVGLLRPSSGGHHELQRRVALYRA